jgi:uncharacterized protein YjbI with pentapeptide repeats
MYKPTSSLLLSVSKEMFYTMIDGSLSSIPASNMRESTRQRVLSNCTFESTIELLSGRYSAVESLIFDSCVFEESINISMLNEITFQNCLLKQNVNVTGGKRLFTVNNCTFDIGISIVIPSHSEDFPFQNNLVHGDVFIASNFTRGISMIGNDIKGKLEFQECTVSHSMTIKGGNKGTIKINKSTFSSATICDLHSELLTLHNSRFHSGLLIVQTIDQIVRLENISGSEIMYCNATAKDTFQANLEGATNLFIDDANIGGLHLSGRSEKTSYIKVRKCNVEVVSLMDVKNDGILEFNNIDVWKEFMIFSSDLKKTDFINCRINKAKMIFINSKVSEIFAAETDFPKQVFDNEKKNYFQAQLAFGQINKAMNLMGDSVKAAEYQSREIYAHYRQLRWLRKSIYFLNLTKLSLWLNYISNDFGRSWGRAVLFSFGLGVIFFYFMTVSTTAFRIAFPITVDWNLVPAYFRFMNPLRFFETEKIYEPLGKGVGLAPRSYIIDFFARVTIAYGFYQVIQAFRRLGKS